MSAVQEFSPGDGPFTVPNNGRLTFTARVFLRDLWLRAGAATGPSTTELEALLTALDGRVDLLEGEIDGHAIEEEGTAIAQRGVLNFTGAGVSVADLAGKTVVTIPGGGGGGGSLDDILAVHALL